MLTKSQVLCGDLYNRVGLYGLRDSWSATACAALRTEYAIDQQNIKALGVYEKDSLVTYYSLAVVHRIQDSFGL